MPTCDLGYLKYIEENGGFLFFRREGSSMKVL